MKLRHLKNTDSWKRLATIFGCGALLICTWGCASRSAEVRQYGQMHDVLSGGAATATPIVTLADAMKEPHAYAVGALPRLAGEITVLDGQAWIARPEGGDLRVEGPMSDPADSAAILTVAHVAHWKEIPIERGLTGDALEAFIAQCARDKGFDMSKPFPFVIEGELTDLQTHVINGACPMMPGARLAAHEQPWRYKLSSPADARVVGFYAADSVGNMTHPGTCVHAHVLLDAGGEFVTGHVERMAVAQGASLWLPSTSGVRP